MCAGGLILEVGALSRLIQILQNKRLNIKWKMRREKQRSLDDQDSLFYKKPIYVKSWIIRYQPSFKFLDCNYFHQIVSYTFRDM